MAVKTLAFAAGVLALQWLPELPPWYVYGVLLPALPWVRRPLAGLPLIFLLGFFWAAVHAEVALRHLPDSELEGRTLLVEGMVVDIPKPLSTEDVRFTFKAQRLDDGGGWQDFGGQLRLVWYRATQQPVLGERWQLAVRLKRPHGYANPGSFDYERWLFQQRIRATGYVRKDQRNRYLGDVLASPAVVARRAIARHFDSQDSAQPGLSMIRALTIGDRGAMLAEQWEVLRATGTSHLMAISGLHISLVAGLAFAVMRRLWSHLGGWPESIPSMRAAAVIALLVAMFYAFLSGFGIPARRALIMLAVAMLALLTGNQSRPAQVLCVAVIATLLLDPLAVLSAGWWLSFWAVTLIVYTNAGRHGNVGWWGRWVRVHVVLAISLVPILLTHFQQASLVAPLANIIAVPWVSLLVVPLALVGTATLFFHEAAGTLLLALAARLLDFLWPCLEWLGGLEFALLQQHRPAWWTLLPAALGILLLFAPRGLPGKWPGLLLLLPLHTVTPSGPEPGGVRVTLLDVGQGLATVIRTRNHTLVYDAGPRYGQGFNTGDAVVVPYLRSQGIRQVDKLVVSHGDNDHVGGVAALLQAVPVASVSAGIPDSVPGQRVSRCRRGERWDWDGVQFSVLYPQAGGRPPQGNNASCVIRIETGSGQAALLTGDIEAVTERHLLQDLAGRLSAAVLVVPHHGSLTSSSRAFVKAVSPEVALFPVGYRNRYRFPRQEVLLRYREAGAELYETARHGAISISLSPQDRRLTVEAYRCRQRRYWHTVSCEVKDEFGCCDK